MKSNAKWLAWTGPLFTVLFALAVLALEGDTPGEKASPASVIDYYTSHKGRTLTSVFLAPLVAGLLVLFVSYLRGLARSLDAGPWPTVTVVGATLWAGGILLGATTTLALVTAADHAEGQVAQTFNVLSNDNWLPFIAGIAITLIGAGMTVLATGLLPRWMGWVALVIGIVSLAGPGGFLGFFVAPLWLLVAGVMLARAPSTAAAEPVAV